MFDWQFFEEENLIEKYNNIKLLDDLLYAHNDLYFDYKNKILHKNNQDIKIEIDFLNNKLLLDINNNTLESDIYYIDIDDNKDGFNIKYQISENEPKYTLIIKRKE